MVLLTLCHKITKPVRGTLFFLIMTGCSYQFTNLQLKLPTDIKNIAVESIYDTSRKVLPHEILWTQLQRAIVSDGHLRLVPQNQADIYLRAHLTQARRVQTDIEYPTSYKEPKKLLTDDGLSAIAPSAFKNMKAADQYAKKEQFDMQVVIEVWDLSHKKVIFTNTYPITANYPINASQATLSSRFLRSEESFQSAFATAMEQLAQNAIRDLLSRLSQI